MNSVRLFLLASLVVLGNTAFADHDRGSKAPHAEVIFALSSDYSSFATEPELARFKAWAEQRAAAVVPTDRRLMITISALDSAGNLESWRGIQYESVPTVRDVYAPRIDLQFKLVAADGTVLDTGTRELRSPGLPMTVTSVDGDDSLRFVKALFNDWLSRDFPLS